MTVQFSEERKAPLEARENANSGYTAGAAKPVQPAKPGEFTKFLKGAGAILAFAGFVLFNAFHDPGRSYTTVAPSVPQGGRTGRRPRTS